MILPNSYEKEVELGFSAISVFCSFFWIIFSNQKNISLKKYYWKNIKHGFCHLIREN